MCKKLIEKCSPTKQETNIITRGMRKILLDEEGITSQEKPIPTQAPYCWMKRVNVVDDVEVLQAPYSSYVPSKFVLNPQETIQRDETKLQVRKPHTCPTNKLRLKSKAISDPSLKSSIIVLDKTLPKLSQEIMVSK